MKQLITFEKLVLYALLAGLVLMKLENDHPSWAFEIVTDVCIVLIAFGFGDVLIRVVSVHTRSLVSGMFDQVRRNKTSRL